MIALIRAEYMLDEMERSMHDALCVIKRTLESGSVVAGGGAVEVALSIYLENFATTLGSREQLAIAEFSSALLVIPKTLASNAAKDSSELVAKLRAYHAAAQASARDDPKKALRFYGLDLHAGQVRDNARAGVVEPLLSKVKSLKAAVRLLPRRATALRDRFPSDRAMLWSLDQADSLPSWKRARRCCAWTTASRSRPKSPPAGTTDTTTRFGDVCNGAVMLSLARLRLWWWRRWRPRVFGAVGIAIMRISTHRRSHASCSRPRPIRHASLIEPVAAQRGSSSLPHVPISSRLTSLPRCARLDRSS